MSATAITEDPLTIQKPIVNGFNHDRFLEQVVELTPGIVYIFNHLSQSNEYANRSIAELLGYSQSEIAAMGDTILAQVIHPEDLGGISVYFDSLATLEPGETSQHEYRTITRSGQIVWLRSYDTVFDRDDKGQLIRHIGVANDITAQKLATAALMDANADLENRIAARTRELADLNAELEARVQARTKDLSETNDELEQLTYIATHDLKVPVNNLCRLAQMMKDETAGMSDEQVELVDWISRAADQAHHKLDALVEVAKARSEALAEPQTLSLEESFAASKEILAHQIDRTGAQITADFAGAPDVVYVSSELESIFDNLLGNALKYTRPGVPPRITVRSWTQEGKAHLSVADNGTGLNLPTDEEKVFGLFRRAHKEPKGNGVALYTIRKRLNRAGGSIHLASTPGEGTAFTITFP